MSGKLYSSGWLGTNGQQDQAKKIGAICGFFALKWGQPPKAKRKSKGSDQPVLDLQKYPRPAAKNKKIRTTYIDYNDPKTKAALDRAVTAKIRADADETALYREVIEKL